MFPLECSPSADDSHQNRNNCDHEEDVDERARAVNKEPKRPGNDEDDRNNV